MGIKLANSKFLRRVFLPIFARLNPGDISMRHHYTQTKFTLHSFRHKGYWFHGKNREQETMAQFAKLIKPGNTVVEIGGHIGYLSVYFSMLVGDHGHVFVFEPSPDNLRYLEKNTRLLTNTTIVPMAVSNTVGHVPFYVELLTGQNNSLVKDYERFSENRTNAFVSAQYRSIEVESVRLDDYAHDKKVVPNFIKIDAEGAEFGIIKGAAQTLKDCLPGLMIECTVNIDQTWNFLIGIGYVPYNTLLRPLPLEISRRGNIFWLAGDITR